MALTYPVDLNKRYTYFDTSIGEPLKDGRGNSKINQLWPTSDGYPPPNLNPKIKLLLEVRAAQPVDGVDYDSSTHRYRRAAPVYDTVAETATYNWDYIALSQAEIDDNADEADRDTKKTNVINQIDILRQWALDAAGTTVTNGNNTVVTQQVVDRLGVFFNRFADLVEALRVDKGI